MVEEGLIPSGLQATNLVIQRTISSILSSRNSSWGSAIIHHTALDTSSQHSLGVSPVCPRRMQKAASHTERRSYLPQRGVIIKLHAERVFLGYVLRSKLRKSP